MSIGFKQGEPLSGSDIQIGDIKVNILLYTDDFVLLSSGNLDMLLIFTK